MKHPNRINRLLILLLGLTWLPFVPSFAQEAAIDIEIPSNKAVLKGTLLTPDKNKPLPVVVIVPGSGKQVRQDLEGMVKYLFSGMELAAFIYDKRGLGESTGTYIPAVAKTSKKIFRQRAKDVGAIVNALKDSPYIDPDHIGLMGSSQGGWIITMVASKDPQVAFTVCISGATSSVGISDYFDGIAEEEPSIEMAIQKLEDYQGVQGFDPYRSILKMESPALWMYGGQDKSNPTARDIRILTEIKEKYDKPFSIQFYPDYNHDFIDVTTNQLGGQFVPDLRAWMDSILKKNG